MTKPHAPKTHSTHRDRHLRTRRTRIGTPFPTCECICRKKSPFTFSHFFDQRSRTCQGKVMCESKLKPKSDHRKLNNRAENKKNKRGKQLQRNLTSKGTTDSGGTFILPAFFLSFSAVIEEGEGRRKKTPTDRSVDAFVQI